MISTMQEEVRYWLCRPDQIVARRQACPVAYIAISTLEWHGPHNPVGTDTPQAEELAVLCAERGGGLRTFFSSKSSKSFIGNSYAKTSR